MKQFGDDCIDKMNRRQNKVLFDICNVVFECDSLLAIVSRDLFCVHVFSWWIINVLFFVKNRRCLRAAFISSQGRRIDHQKL